MKPAPRLPYGALVTYKASDGRVHPSDFVLCVIIGTFKYRRDGTGLENCFGVDPQSLEEYTGHSGYLLMPSTGQTGWIHSFWHDVQSGHLSAV